MNDWKCAITLATCCCVGLTIAPSASADFVGVTTVHKDDPDTAFLCTEANGDFVFFPLAVCNVFAVFDNPDDALLSVGHADLQVFNGAIPDVFFQHPASPNSPRAPDCTQITDPPPFGFPDLICDSFITIGIKCGGISPSDGTAPDREFDFGEFSSNGHIVGGWFYNNPAGGVQGVAGEYPDLQVLFLQSSVVQGLSLSGTIDLFWWVDHQGETYAELDVPIECTAAGDPAEIPTVSEWGLILMLLLALTAGTIVFARRRRPAVA